MVGYAKSTPVSKKWRDVTSLFYKVAVVFHTFLSGRKLVLSVGNNSGFNNSLLVIVK